MMKRKYYHGDVILRQVDGVPEGAKIVLTGGKIVLARGEATGHAHVITDTGAELYSLEGALFLKVDRPVTVTHEEHKPGTIAPGVYDVRIVRERDHLAQMTRQVVD